MNELDALAQQMVSAGWMDPQRASEFARALQAYGISDLNQLQGATKSWVDEYDGMKYDPVRDGYLRPGSGMYGTEDYTADEFYGGRMYQLQLADGRKLGYLGDFNNDGSFGSKANPNALQGNLLAWSATGDGNTGYNIQWNPDGTFSRVGADWGSSSDMDKIRQAALVMGAVFGAGYGAEALGAGAGNSLGSLGGATGAGSGSMGLTSSDLAAIFGDAGYGSGMSGAATGIYDAGVNGSWLSSLFGGGGSGLGGWGSLLNLGGNLLNGYMGSRAAGQASDAQLQAAREALALQAQMYNQTRQDFAPYREAGTSALGQIQALLANPSSVANMPDYKFGMDQGTKALNNSAASRGMTYSGAQGKALQRFGQDYANDKLNQSYNRLASIAGIGQQATGATAGAGQNYANQGGNQLNNMGDARGSGYMGSANAWGQAVGNQMNYWQQQNLLRQFGMGG